MNQQEFRAALLDPGKAPPDGLIGPGGRPAGRRFDVYRNNVTYSLTEALRQAFPVVEKLVGPEFFAAMAREFLRAHPPASPLMMFYGAAMPGFLAGFPPVAHLRYLPDIARLELALRESYHAADAAPVPAEELAALPPERLMAARLGFAPSVRLVASSSPIFAIWSANRRGTAPPSAQRPEDVLIARPGFDPEPHLLPAGAAGFLSALAAGATVGEAIESADDFDLTATFSILLGAGAIAAIRTGESE